MVNSRLGRPLRGTRPIVGRAEAAFGDRTVGTAASFQAPATPTSLFPPFKKAESSVQAAGAAPSPAV
jgi:hypothetical protein